MTRDWNDDSGSYVRYLPSAVDTIILGNAEKYRDFRWFYDDSLSWRYPYVLISAANAGINSGIRHRLPSDMYILGDSGGFTIGKGERYLNPVQVLRWQERNCSEAVMLDLPPSRRERIPLERSLQESLEYTRIMLDNKERKDLRMLTVLHGFNEQQVERWYNEMSALGKTDAWATSVRTYQDWSDSDPSTTARRLLFLGERGAKRIHIFKGSGIDSILTIVWFTMRRLKGVYVTFDSVTWLSEHYGDIHHPLIHAWVDDFKRVHNRSNIVPICGCPFCANLKYTSVPAIREGKRDYKYVMGYNNHNVWSLWFLIESLIE